MIKFLFLFLFVTSVHAAVPVPSFTATPTSGVAPVAVFFDATATTDADTTTPFHDLLYRWSFGDPNAGKWSYGANTRQTKNQATGPIAAHVFETPGTYVVTMRVNDAASTVQATTTITVTDPETVFATTTACIANGVTPVAGVGGCPAVATLLYNSSNFYSSLGTAITAGARRILYRGGDTFTFASTYTNTTAGPGYIGKYGSGTVTLTGTVNTSMIAFNGITGWTIADFTTTGAATSSGQVIGANSASTDILVLRMNTSYFAQAVNSSAVRLSVVDCIFQEATLFSGQSGYGMYYSGIGPFAVLGSYVNIGTTTSGHGIRLQPTALDKFVISNNTITNGGATNLSIRGTSSSGVVSDNKFIGGTASSVLWFAPQNTTSNEYIYDIIYERNWLISGTGASVFGAFTMSYGTFRNNIFNTSSYVSGSGIQIGYSNTRGTPIPRGNNFYNNTFYSTTAGNYSAFRQTPTTSPVFVASPAGTNSTTMTISSVTSGNVAVGGTLSGGTLSGNPTIVSYGTFTNVAGTGTINLSSAQTWADATNVTEVTTVTGSTFKNNIAYAPNATKDGAGNGSAPTLIFDQGVSSTGAAGTMGNSSDSQIKNTSPSFASATPSNPEDFCPNADSYAWTVPGSAVPVTTTQDFRNCKAKDGTIYRGACVPKANMLCWAAR